MRSRKPQTMLFAASLLLGLVSTPVARLSVAQDSQSAQTPDRQYGPLRMDVSRGVRITLGNRTTGRITVNGWDRDVIEAHSVSERGNEVVIARRSGSSSDVFLKADYADLEKPADPTSLVDAPPVIDGKILKVHLEVSVPRYAEIELIKVRYSDVQVSGVETPIAVSGAHSGVILKHVGAVAVHTDSGGVEVEDTNGSVEIATTSGAVRVNNSRGLVRVVSITGPIEVKCARGRIDVANTEAPIELANIDGDVDAVATNSSVRFTGKLREEGRYYLKSLSGRVEMILPTNTHGFNATLSSYRGLIETDFKLSTKQSASDATQNRRLAGSFGNGKAQITLDSFEGLVRLTKVASGSVATCR